MVGVTQTEIPPDANSNLIADTNIDAEDTRPLVGIIYPPPDIRSAYF